MTPPPASSPITAIERTDGATGSTEALFFSRTLPSCATFCETAAFAAEVTTASRLPVWVRSKRPRRNIDASTLRVWSSTVACDTWPELTALVSALP